jgi:hypothetical protein
MPGTVVMGLFCTYLTPIQAVTTVEGQTSCYEIKYIVARLSCVRSKIQQLCLICYAIDIGDSC